MSRAARTVGLTAAATDLFLLVAAYFGLNCHIHGRAGGPVGSDTALPA